jgi:hypothetical protein
MAQEKARATRARGTKKAADAAAAPKALRKPRTRRMSVERNRDEIAVLAYLMWERGEPGDATDHWLRAERELAA